MLSNHQELATTVWDGYAAPPASAPNLHYHLVFYAESGVTLSEEWRAQFYRFLSGCAMGLGCKALVGGTGIRVDLLISLPATTAVADFVRRMKVLSASWARRKTALRNFAWHSAEQISTVSPSQRGRIEKQIAGRTVKPAPPGEQNKYALPDWRAPRFRGRAIQI